MIKQKVFVSFDWTNDKHYKFLLEAWHKNDKFDFVFDDATPEEINSNNVGRIKAALTAKIKNATHTLVIIGKEANKLHWKNQLIEFRNWITFEVYQCWLNKNKIIAVRIDRENEAPEKCLNIGAKWVTGFSEAGIIKALNEA